MAGVKETESLDFRRVQRPTDDLPVVHLEAGIPAPEDWRLSLGGEVALPIVVSAEEIRSMPVEERTWDLNCVWGWVRRSCRWEGVPAAALIDMAGPLPGARYVVAEAAPAPAPSTGEQPSEGAAQPEIPLRVYASCLSLQEARDSLIAWKLDGEELSPEHGGPLRLVPPPNKWGYKGVKWLYGMTVSTEFKPGFWEEMVGNPVGDIPEDLLDNRFE